MEKEKEFSLDAAIQIEEEMLLEEELGDKNEEVRVGLNKRPDGEKGVDEPRVGMMFNYQEQLVDYYIEFAKQEGFGVTKRSCKSGDDGRLRYFTLACARQGKGQSEASNVLRPKPITRTDCRAKINACLCTDGRFKVSSVVLEHNHLLSPNKARYFRCNRRLDPHVKKRLELNDMAGIRANKSINSLFIEAGGYENASFIGKDCRNHIEQARRSRLGDGDAEAMRNYFVRMRSRNDRFYYVMDLDDEFRLKNVFWADARSRAAYESFGDVVTFDTTYLTNSYKMPFAPFVGVNHHGQSVLLGCGLLLHEDISSFVWLFQSWLACMSGQAPNAIITDQDKAMQKAIEMVFPKARHRWCLWHIMKKIPEKLKGYSEYKSIKAALKNVVYDSLTRDEFEEHWEGLIQRYNLYNNEWLSGLYNERHRWVPAFVKDSFWAGMSTTQRSEGMNAFFDGYVNIHSTLKQFVEQYDNALRSKVENEKLADYSSFNSKIPLITHYNIEKQFQEVYTNDKFREIQEEFRKKMYCYPSLAKKEGIISTYNVNEEIKTEERIKDVIFKVDFNEEECEVQCTCHLFEFKGILCRHVLTVLTIMRKVKLVPSKYILERWRKDFKRKHTTVNNCYDNFVARPEDQRLEKMNNCFSEVSEMGMDTDDRCMMVITYTRQMKEKMYEYIRGSSQHTQKTLVALPIYDDNLYGVTKESNKVLNPVQVSTKGRPPSKRKESKVDQIVKRRREKKNKSTQKKDSQLRQNVEENRSEVDLSTNTSLLVSDIGTQESLDANSTSFFGGNFVGPKSNYSNFLTNQSQGYQDGYNMNNLCIPTFHRSQLQDGTTGVNRLDDTSESQVFRHSPS